MIFKTKKLRGLRTKAPDFDLTYDPKAAGWDLEYKQVHWFFDGPTITLPTTEILDRYLSWVSAHQTNIVAEIQGYVAFAASRGEYMNGEDWSVSYISVEAGNELLVGISGDETWGDLNYDLKLKDGEIVDYGWSD